MRLREAGEALRCARQAARYAETDSLAFDLAGRAHAALGELREAREAFRKARLLNPKDAVARDHWLLAVYAAGSKRMAYARA